MKMSPGKQRMRGPMRWIAVAALVGAGVGISASPAQAASSTTCTGASTVAYSPPLTNTPQTVGWTESDTYACTSTDTTLTSGTSVNHVTAAGSSCVSGSAFPYTTYTINWNNGQSSTISATVTDVILAGIETLTATGTVTSGEFTGGTVVIVWVYTVPNPLLCLTTGITNQTGTAAAQILVVP